MWMDYTTNISMKVAGIGKNIISTLKKTNAINISKKGIIKA
jgi:hypothetical protein